MAAGFLSAPAYAPAPGGRKTAVLLLLAVLAAAGVFAVQWRMPPPVLDEDALQAAKTMKSGLLELRRMRGELGIPLQGDLDPSHSGLIGVEYSDLTTTLGDLRAKRASHDPRFAALMVLWLKEAGAREGDAAAISLSGSFPALNLAALAACDALGLQARVISSVGASSYGANIPGFTWLDMETRLLRAGIIRSRTACASPGGIADTGGGLGGTGLAEAKAAIARHGAFPLPEGSSLDAARDIERRMAFYTERGAPKVFINVGGNATSLGWTREAELLGAGLLRRVPKSSGAARGVIFRMAEAGVPVIHMLHIRRIAAENSLLEESWENAEPAAGDDGGGLAAARREQLWRLGSLLAGWAAFGAWAVRRESVAAGGKTRIRARQDGDIPVKK